MLRLYICIKWVKSLSKFEDSCSFNRTSLILESRISLPFMSRTILLCLLGSEAWQASACRIGPWQTNIMTTDSYSVTWVTHSREITYLIPLPVVCNILSSGTSHHSLPFTHSKDTVQNQLSESVVRRQVTHFKNLVGGKIHLLMIKREHRLHVAFFQAH